MLEQTLDQKILLHLLVFASRKLSYLFDWIEKPLEVDKATHGFIKMLEEYKQNL